MTDYALTWINLALLVIAVVLASLILVRLDWLRRVLPAWLFHIDCLVRGQDPPGDAPIPEMPPGNPADD